MKILCICHYGHSRSAALVRMLHHHKYDAICCGVGTAGEWLETLCREADMIVLMEEGFRDRIIAPFQYKIKVMDIGRDQWSNPFSFSYF